MQNPNAPQHLEVTQRNTELPFFPSISWPLIESDKGNFTLPTFHWIQAFFNSTTLTEEPVLAIWSGKYASDGVTKIVSPVRFAFSGERINFKGKAIVATGVDIFGNTVTSLVIGSDATTDFSAVIAYGGSY